MAFVIGKRKGDIQKFISPDYLPETYGGDVLDAKFLKSVKIGKDVPEKYYVRNRKKTSQEDMERVVVRGQSSHIVPHEVEEIGGTMQWVISTPDYDIDLKVTMNRDVAEKKAITKRGSFHVCKTELAIPKMRQEG